MRGIPNEILVWLFPGACTLANEIRYLPSWRSWKPLWKKLQPKEEVCAQTPFLGFLPKSSKACLC